MSQNRMCVAKTVTLSIKMLINIIKHPVRVLRSERLSSRAQHMSRLSTRLNHSYRVVTRVLRCISLNANKHIKNHLLWK